MANQENLKSKQDFFSEYKNLGLSDLEAYKMATAAYAKYIEEINNALRESDKTKMKVGNALKTAGAIGMTIGGIPLMLLNPIGTTAGFTGMTGTNEIVKALTDYEDWGSMVQDKTGISKDAADLFNPGMFIGGGLGSKADKTVSVVAENVLPDMIKRFGLKQGTKKAIQTGIINYLLNRALPANKTILGNNITNLNILKTPSNSKLPRANGLPLYTGNTHSVKELFKPDGTVDVQKAWSIMREAANNARGKGVYPMNLRLENPQWHIYDPTTWDHIVNVTRSAYNLPTPEGFSLLDYVAAAMGHDFGKMAAGDGHGPIGAAWLKQIFPDMTDALYTAIAEHMNENPSTALGQAVKAADMDNGKIKQSISYSLLLGNNIMRLKKNEHYTPLESPIYVENNPSLGNAMLWGIYRPGSYSEAMSKEFLRRLQDNYGIDPKLESLIDMVDDFGEPIISIGDLYLTEIRKPSYIVTSDGLWGGKHNSHNDNTYINMSRTPDYVSTAFHERNMHGTDDIVNDALSYNAFDSETGTFGMQIRNPYISAVELIFNGSRPSKSADSAKWYELRATIGEVVRNMYKSILAANKPKGPFNYEDILAARPVFESTVDKMDVSKLAGILGNTNGYGKDYAEMLNKDQEEKLLPLFKSLLKKAPAVGLLTTLGINQFNNQ